MRDRAECARWIADASALTPMAASSFPFDALIFDVGGVIVPHDNDMLHRRLAQRCSVANAQACVGVAVRDRRYATGELPIADLHERSASATPAIA